MWQFPLLLRSQSGGSRDPAMSSPGGIDAFVRLPIVRIYEAADARPEAVALRCGGANLSYRELTAAADHLATEIIGKGLERDVPIGICLERSFDYVIGMLAACRAGGAFLLLDPRWPEDRLRFMLDDSNAPVVVAEGERIGSLAGTGRRVIAAGAPHVRSDLRRKWAQPAPDDLAYIIYTSGSAGAPKGVEITHRNLRNLLDWHIGRFEVTEQDRASSLAGLGFDASVWEIWSHLCAGASVVLADEAARASADALKRFLIEEEITIAFVPTSLAEPLISTTWPEQTKLRFLLTGGDTLHTHAVAGLPFVVVNNYGPTECTVVATSGVVAPDESEGIPTIGCPIPGAQIHILDPSGRRAQPEEIGEICIGGACVGRGYRNRPELTANKFVTVSFCDGGGGRLYRTGDLGRRLADGEIEFHGRLDNQIKLRGHRIELDEISAALNRHPMIVQSAVVARDERGGMQPIAYLVLRTNLGVDAQSLRGFLASRLPDYMLPGCFVSVSSLPLTSSGKIDIARLPDPDDANLLPQAGYREPESPVERRIAEIVAELLKIDRVGSDDNFFLLGGHSLLGTQLVLRIRDAFGVEVRLRDLFKAQTIAKLATSVEGRIVERVEQMSEEEAGALLAG